MIEKIKLLYDMNKSEKIHFDNIYKFLNFAKKEGIYPEKRTVETSPGEPEVIVDGKKVLMFSSNNYLGLSGEKSVTDATLEGAKKFGIGPGTSRLLSGNIKIYEELEELLARMVGKESAIFLTTGYMTNESLFRVVMDPYTSAYPIPYKKGSGVIISDEDNHASIINGTRLTSAERVVFKHNDMKDLEKVLKKFPLSRRKLIVTEGSFSLEGVLCPLPEIVELAKKYNAMTMIDDAHGVGVLGKNGGGTAEYYDVIKDVDIIMGSCSKALGGMGGFVAGKKELIEYFRIATRSYMYSSPVSACVTYGLKEAVSLSLVGNDRREKLYSNYHYLAKELKTLGFEILGDGRVPVVPLMIHDEKLAVKMNKALFEKGIYVESFRWPAVPEGQARIRIVPMAHHTKEHLDALIVALKEVGRELKIIGGK